MMMMMNERQQLQQLRQDSLLTTITTTTSTAPMINHNPCLRSALTTLSLSEELRKQKEQNETIDWFSFFFLCGCFKNKEKRKKKNKLKKKKKNWRQSRYCTWKWICLWITLFFLIVGGILIFFCWPRLPFITLANIADPFGQESADWGPPDHPFYKTNWQLNITLNNQPNFIPLNIVQMDLTLNMHFSTNASTFSNLSSSISTASSLPSIDNNSNSSNNNNINKNNNNNDNNYKNNPFTYSLAYTTLPSIVLNKNETKTLNALFHIDYAASTSNLSDPIFAQLYNACGPHLINSPPALNISLQVTFHLLHYLWSSTVNIFPTGGSGLICPTD